MPKKINPNIKNILICPKCQGTKLFFNRLKFQCQKCGKEYDILNNKFVFVKLKKEDINDPFDKLKYHFKQFSTFYNFMIRLISPVYLDYSHLKKFLEKQSKNKIIINLGSGNTNIIDNIINVDIVSYQYVDIVTNINNLPLKDKSVDIVINIAVLEHVPNSENIVREIYRVLKTNGLVYSFIPFIQGFHASPFDFQRWTVEGTKNLFKDFKIIEIKNGEGPTSGFLWIFQEFMAISLSFGIKSLYYLIYFIVIILTFPLKYLDILLIRHPMAKNIAGGFIYIGRKK